MIKPIIILFNTIRHLKPAQLVYFVVRRKFPAKVQTATDSVPLINHLQLTKPIYSDYSYQFSHIDQWQFAFLSVEKCYSPHNMDWAPDDTSRLWLYNLHYFDYLREKNRPLEECEALLSHWVQNNPQGRQPGWEPFTASLRIVNWIFFIIHNPGLATEPILRNLHTQVRWLELNDERHILANHYFENLKALLFAGYFFDDDNAKRWRELALTELANQLHEQTLDDGGHYERTPQYHALMVENYLDICNFAISNYTIVPKKFRDLVENKAIISLRFLSNIVFPDNKIPLFNDSAFDIAPKIGDLIDYASRLGLIEKNDFSLERYDFELISMHDSGLYGCRMSEDMFIIDCGSIGPSYQPGHTHCDMLSYELMFAGRRIIVDSGVGQYEPGPMRTLVRSTAAHNTVSVDGDEQSEVWGEFRVARRAKVLNANIARNNSIVFFEGAYKGFYGIPGRATHSRSAVLTCDTDLKRINEIEISDQVSGKGTHNVESFIHLHPDLEVLDVGNGLISLNDGSATIAEIQINTMNYEIRKSYYFPEFGKRLNNKKIVIKKEGSFPLTLNYTIRKVK